MFFHFSVFLVISKKKKIKFDQKKYDHLFNYIEYNLRESGLGDVSVNKKMKELNKIFYDILLKLDEKKQDKSNFKINRDLVYAYFPSLKSNENSNSVDFYDYFSNFFIYCFNLPFDKMIEESINFKN